MSEHLLTSLSAIVVLGIGAQWIAWRLGVPSILLLLIFGFLAGPISQVVLPSELFGPALIPIVSLAVGLILFDGGLSLNLSDLAKVGRVIRNLISVGALVTWVLTTLAASLFLPFDFAQAALLGAILVVTGPTVIGPLLRHIRPSAEMGAILRWEGIAIDPVGATLAVLVYQVILAGEFRTATGVVLSVLLKTIFIGSLIGFVAAALMVLFLRRYWIPDYLETAITLMLVVGAFTISNHVQSEAGLLTVTIMGVVLANQKWVSVLHITEFKENLRVLLLSSIFIVLAADLKLSDLAYLDRGAVLFTAALILVARPASIWLSTLGSELSWKEKVFLSWMAPRGVVAAAVASVFALRLAEQNLENSNLLVPITFLVITSTITVYGLTAGWVAKFLGVSSSDQQGVLIVGAHRWARLLAEVLSREGFPTLLVDKNWSNIAAARQESLRVYFGNILSESVMEEVNLDGIGKLVALTASDEINSLAAMHFRRILGRAQVFQLPPSEHPARGVNQELTGRLLFDDNVHYHRLSALFQEGAQIKVTELTDEHPPEIYLEEPGLKIPLFLISQGELLPFTVQDPPKLAIDSKVVGLVLPSEQTSDAPGESAD